MRIVRYILFHEHELEGISESIRKNGGEWEQACHTETLGDDCGRGVNPVVHLGIVLLKCVPLPSQVWRAQRLGQE